ncbi:class I adenylate-forming enzyme family protein, partial [Streptomyces sp. NPDC055078]
RHPGRIALRDGDRSLTYAEVHDRALRLAGGLRAHGIGPGDTVALHLPNSLWLPVVYFGILCSGATAAALNPAQPTAMVRRQLADLGAAAVVTHPSCAPRLVAAGTEGMRLVAWAAETAVAPAGPDGAVPPGSVPLTELLAAEPLTGYAVPPETVAHLQLTGGTTGVAKGVRIPHSALVAHTVQIAAWRAGCLTRPDGHGGLTPEPVPDATEHYPLHPGDTTALTVAPMFHGLALVGHVFNTMMGATVVMSPRFDPESYLAGIEEHRVSYLVGTPSFYHALLLAPGLDTYDLSSVRLLVTGGGPIDASTLARLRARFTEGMVVEGYGLSEATSALVLNIANRGGDGPARLGRGARLRHRGTDPGRRRRDRAARG